MRRRRSPGAWGGRCPLNPVRSPHRWLSRRTSPRQFGKEAAVDLHVCEHALTRACDEIGATLGVELHHLDAHLSMRDLDVVVDQQEVEDGVIFCGQSVGPVGLERLEEHTEVKRRGRFVRDVKSERLDNRLLR